MRCVAISSALALALCMSAPAVAQQAPSGQITYFPVPAGQSAGVARLDLRYFAETLTPEAGNAPDVFLIRRTDGRRFYIQVRLEPTSLRDEATRAVDVGVPRVIFPIVTTYDGQLDGRRAALTQLLPEAGRDAIRVRVRMVSRVAAIPLAPVAPHVREQAFTLGYWEYWRTAQPGPMILTPTLDTRWLDQYVGIEVQVSIDDHWLDPRHAGKVYTKRLHEIRTCPAPGTAGSLNCEREPEVELRVRRGPSKAVAPFFVPTTILGKPPGDRSWARFTATAGAGATLTLFDGTESSRTLQTGWQVGPFSSEGPEETVFRAESQGRTETIAY